MRKTWFLVSVTGDKADTPLYIRHSAWYVDDPGKAHHFESKNKAIKYCKDIGLHDYRIITRKGDQE